METEYTAVASVASASSLWRMEPYRLFFILGVLLSWVGVGHWLLYALGVSATYSCQLHGLIQMQGFMMSFATGFLLTALPRRTQSAPPTFVEMAVIALALIGITVASVVEDWAAAQVGYAVIFAVLIRFAVTRFLGAASGRRPPAAFVLIPIGIAHALLGAAAIFAEATGRIPQWALGFGLLLVEQGVFLCLAIGVGSLVLPLIAGAPPPPDLGSSPSETRRALVFAAAGAAIFVTLLLEQTGWVRAGPFLRAVIVAAGLGPVALRATAKRGLHRQFVRVSVWMIPLGLTISALWPDYRVPALHIVFIGGFGLMAFAVATHVAVSHLDLGDLAVGRPWPVVVLGVSFSLALAARLFADASESYFVHLGWAAGCWIVGSALWLVFFAPKLLHIPK